MPALEPDRPGDLARLKADSARRDRLDGRSPREVLADCLQAVLVTGLDQVRREVLSRAGREDPALREELLRWTEAIATESPDRIRRAVGLWFDGSYNWLQGREPVSPTGPRTPGVDEAIASMPRDLPISIRILGDEFAHVLGDRAIALPALSPGADPLWSVHLFCLAAVSTLEPELDERVLQPTLRAVVLDGWPELVVQAVALMLSPSHSPSLSPGAGTVASSTASVTASAAATTGATPGARPRSAIDPGDGPILSSLTHKLLAPFEAWPADPEQLAKDHGLEPFSRDARRLVSQQPRMQLQQAGVDPVRLGGFDLVQTAFEWLASSGEIPSAAAPLVWRLQRPMTILAALDPGYLAEESRSLRRLLAVLCDAARHAPEQLVCGGPLLDRLETAVRAIEVMAQQVQTRTRVLSQQFDRELQRAAQGVTAVLGSLERERDQVRGAGGRVNRRDVYRRPSPEQEAAATQAVRSLLEGKISQLALPESVRIFLDTVWIRHLRTTVLRDGESSQQFQSAMQAVDDLIWTLDGGLGPVSRSQLARRIPSLVQTLSQGARSVGLSDEEVQPFMDDLFLAHLRRIQRSPAGGHDPTSVRRPAGSSSGIPLVRILREARTDDCPPNATPTPASADDALQILKAGDWLQMQSGTELSRMKVVWLNADRSVVLLIREQDRKAMSLRGRELQERFARRTAMLLV